MAPQGGLSALRAALAAGSDAERVEVNHRHLIDKILARYSTPFTVYRELFQNSDDAGASAVQVAFQRDSSGRLATLLLRNNGRTFAPDDWRRLRSIAEGNPDPTRVGFFGVGFYSVFSICEEPLVVSGGRSLAFSWRENTLYTSASDSIPSEGKTV